MKVGIIGLEDIGSASLPCFEALGTPVAYFGPREKSVLVHFDSEILSLARESDLLVITCPLPEVTRQLVNAVVAEALTK